MTTSQTERHPARKKDFVESLITKRLQCLERAACYEELIKELGGSIEPRMEEEGEFHEPRRRNDSNGDDDGRSENASPEATRLDGGPDHRFKGNETEAIDDARRMRNGPDGRGEVKNEDDGRLKGNESEALSRARHMEDGDDGRGEVTDSENDHRLKKNLSKRAKA